MVSYPVINIVDTVIDEIALEGLDGITLEALWQRLSMRLHIPLPLSKSFMEQVWGICLKIDGLDFYKLKSPRARLILFDRYEFVDPDLGTILEPDDVPDDIYPHFPIDDIEAGIKGSCSTYKSRKNISEHVRTLTVHQAFDEFGQRLVLIASQEIREQALTGNGVCPTLELTVMQYCFLERVGRSRYHGEVTQGKISLGLLKEDPKSLFYHRKFLLDHKLITKQIHHQKTGGHSCSGSLLHLPRFYVERKPKVIYLAEQVIEILKSKENCVAEYDEIKKELQIENSIKKLFRTAFFQKVVKTDLRVPYRMVYPKAEDKEWQQKNNPTKEKTVRVVQLLDPETDVTELWGKDEINDDDEPFELDISELKINVPLLKQANRMVELSGREGISQCQLAKSMGQTKLQARTMLRNLVKLNIVATYMHDVGRQRVTKFVSKRFEKSSEMSRQFEQEMDKIKQLTKTMDLKNQNSSNSPLVEETAKTDNEKSPNANPIIEKPEISTAVDANNSVVDSVKVEKTFNEKQSTNRNEYLQLIESNNQKENRLRMKFVTVSWILSKYSLTKFKKKYKRTFLNLSEQRSLHSQPKLDLISSMKEDKKPRTPSALADRARIAEQILVEQSKREPNLKAVDQVEVISFYDSIEVKLVEQKPQHCLGKPTSQVIGFMEDLHINEKKNISSITYRLLKRANMIIEAVKEHKVIDDLTKLIKMINEEEDREGYDVKIDKKSIIRLLQKLAKDNVVKNIKLTLRLNHREKNLTFICDPTIGIDHTVIQSAVEQAKIKFCLLGAQKVRAIVQKQQSQDEESLKVFNEDRKGLEAFNSSKKSKSTTVNLKYDFKAGKRYGYSPKFVRMQMLHIFLFYVVYDHPGEPTISQEEQIAKLRTVGYQIDAQLEEEMSTIYNPIIGWKMFIPPLTRHAGWPLGWTIMCDVLLRMPLSIFVKIHNVPFFIPDLLNYLNHPIKKHFLVKNLPAHIRNTLLIARKYIYNIHESATRLCYIGLLQFGPQKLKEKDQVFIYINRRTEITDTTSSAAGYHKIENKEYPKTSYFFDSLQVVEKYWYDMWNTCINTYLGGRLVVQGKDILLEDLSKKTDMIKAVKARAPEEAVALDNGTVPGDHIGAAGVDSAFFAHLKRNWNWGTYYTNQQYGKGDERKKIDPQRSAHLSKIKAKPLKFTEFSGLKKVTGPATQHATELRKKIHQKHKTAQDQRSKQQEYQKLVSQHIARQKSFVRRVLPRKRKLKPRVKYDEVDFCALQQMDKLRVDWNPHEDNILLMCKVAMMYLCPNPRKQLITFTAVRDVLRTYSAHSYNKTSRACQRRLLYMFRKPQTANSVALGVEEIKQNFYINKRFGGIVEKLKTECKNSYEYEEQVANIFKELVAYIDKRYYNISDMESRESVMMPKTIQEFNLLYKLKHPTHQSSLQTFPKEIKCVNGIYSATINSVIHSSMCCGKDRTSWAYQLFKVYQQYPETLLRSAMNKIRSDQMVSIKKSYMCALKKYGNCMPMSSSQYQLSTGYIYKFQTKWPYEIFNEAHQMICKLVQWQYENQSTDLNYAVSSNVDGIKAGPITGGLVVGIHDYLARGQLDFDIEIPDQIIMLDPRLKEKDETYLRIAQRYQDILMSLDQLKLRKKQSVETNLMDPEVEEEDEMERRELEDKIVKEKRDKEDRDRWNYWKSRNDDIGKRVEEFEVKSQRDKEDRERNERRNKFDNQMVIRKKKYAQVLELGEENVPEAIVSEFRNPDDEKTESESDQEENDEAYEDEDNRTIRFQDGTTITLSKEDIELSSCNSDEEDSMGGNKETNFCSKLKKEKTVQKRRRSSIDTELPHNKKAKSEQEQVLQVSNSQHDSDKNVSKESCEVKVSLQSNVVGSLKRTEINRLEEDNCENVRSPKRTQIDNDLGETSEQIIQDIHVTSQCTNKDGPVTSGKKNITDTSDSQMSAGTRINDLLKKMHNMLEVEYGGGDIWDFNDMQKRSTRIALLMMREELNDLAVLDSHHAHDYFVVNMFKIFYSLKLSDTDQLRSLESFHNMKVPRDILPLNTHIAKQVIEDVKRFAVFPKEEILFEDFLSSIEDKLEADINNLQLVYKYIRDRREIGATSKQIMSKFKTVPKDCLCRIISLLTEHRLLLRSGVTTARYIQQQFTDPWLIHSYKILRLEKESLMPIDSRNSFIAISDDNTPIKIENAPTDTDSISSSTVEKEMIGNNNVSDVTEQVSMKIDSDNDLLIDQDKEISMKVESKEDAVIVDNQIAESNDVSENAIVVSGRRMQRKRTSLLQSKDIQKAAKKLNFNTAEAIKVVIKPWIRIDGVLNRKVLDRMLGAVLGYCINHPGIILVKVQRRFVPALQPFHTTELVEMLVKLECLRMKAIQKPRVTLFSKPTKISLSSATGMDSEEELVLEPEIDASIKFAMFLDNKMYSIDFLT